MTKMRFATNVQLLCWAGFALPGIQLVAAQGESNDISSFLEILREIHAFITENFLRLENPISLPPFLPPFVRPGL